MDSEEGCVCSVLQQTELSELRCYNQSVTEAVFSSAQSLDFG